MRQSKEQKHRSAVERDRRHYNAYSLEWRSWQVGGDNYQKCLRLSGKDYADRRRTETDYWWKKYLIRAEIDSSGNPLSSEELATQKRR